MWARFHVLGKSSIPAAWLALLLTKAADVESNPGPTKHTNKDTSVIWICDPCYKSRNKPQSDVTTHTQHTLGSSECTHIQQRQYKPDWRCTIHTLTQNITTTSSTDNTTPHHKQTNTHSQTTINQRTKHRHTSNQHKRHQKQNRGTKKN